VARVPSSSARATSFAALDIQLEIEMIAAVE
jgi:hypothetical protein